MSAVNEGGSDEQKQTVNWNYHTVSPRLSSSFLQNNGVAMQSEERGAIDHFH